MMRLLVLESASRILKKYIRENLKFLLLKNIVAYRTKVYGKNVLSNCHRMLTTCYTLFSSKKLKHLPVFAETVLVSTIYCRVSVENDATKKVVLYRLEVLFLDSLFYQCGSLIIMTR